MKGFFKDYLDLCKHSCRWLKKHWKGYTVLCTLLCGAEVAWFYRESIKDKINEKVGDFKSKKESKA